MFQSLIGILLNCNAILEVGFESGKFQSLIGILLNCNIGVSSGASGIIFVSIPNRDFIELQCWRLKALLYLVFKVQLREWMNHNTGNSHSTRYKSLKASPHKVRGWFKSAIALKVLYRWSVQPFLPFLILYTYPSAHLARKLVRLPIATSIKISDRLILAHLNLPNQGIPLVRRDALSDDSAHSHP